MADKGKKWLFVSALLVLLAATVYVCRHGKPPAVETVALRPSGYTYVIDAGHGGVDGGATSATGLYESHVNLQIARKTELLLNLYGLPTVMTRREDISIHDSDANTIRAKKVSDLNNRVKLINATPNALLVSLHQNSFTQAQYFGTQCFFVNGTEALADRLQKMVASSLDPSNKRQCKPVPREVFLFDNINCPAVLVECGFLSNSGDAAKLADGSYQSKLAACIAATLLT